MYVGMILLVAWNYLRQLTHALSNKAIGGCANSSTHPIPAGRSAAAVAQMYHVPRYFRHGLAWPAGR